MLSGHSLGGALAQLAAHDIATAAREQMTLRIKVICYTYGSPRVGNHSFAREYDKLVPHTWHLVNDQDAVARAPKFLCLYKKTGQRVIINHSGDMLVRPSFIETSLFKKPFGGSIANHLLGDYLRSLLAVLLLQFSRKRFPGGMDGVVRLAEKSEPMQRLLLDGIGLTIEDMRRLARWHGRVINPALANASASVLVAQKLAARRAEKRKEARKLRVSDKDTAADGLGEIERQAEDRVPVDRMSDTSILGNVKKHLKVWVTLRRPIGKECENCGDRSMGLGQLSDDTSPGQDGMSHNSMFDSDEPSVHSSAPAASV
ncbi:hypothetical protein CVIRNUC_009297 [Coccomyxa viridis]|uniref:Fungal lipase-type domain-containing protein n=1 Tax=Coccomyxa viridis TaxID=1274662 RepID=A0AAV1IG59_9CHLO|nr:hypothetical protein CVIRNUC_009297 [Coccomyxa viridis]